MVSLDLVLFFSPRVPTGVGMWQGAREVSWTPTEFSLALLEHFSRPLPRKENNQNKPCQIQISGPASAPFDIVRQRLSLGLDATHRARISHFPSVS